MTGSLAASILRRMNNPARRLALAVALICAACSHAKDSTAAEARTDAARAGAAHEGAAPGPAATASMATAAPDAGAPSAPKAPAAAPNPGPNPAPGPGPITAAEAAIENLTKPAAASAPAPATDDTAPCTTDDECGFTRVGVTDCCPMMCTPRVVTKKRSAELEARIAVCHPGPNQCPVPSCMPPRSRTAPSCQQGKCVAKNLGSALDLR